MLLMTPQAGNFISLCLDYTAEKRRWQLISAPWQRRECGLREQSQNSLPL